ncbi:hypothetical protein Ndes2437A_g03301 [Nannochloris sp. 'desiccata']
MPGPVGLAIRGVKELDKYVSNKFGPTNPTDGPVTTKEATVSPIDEEGEGAKASPEVTGVPRDPANASSKKRSFYAIVIAGAALSVDYSMAMMSTQALYYSLNGPQKLYGLTFGAYDLTGMILAPIWSWWSDKSGRFKRQFNSGNVINICGNIIYACSYIANAWWMMLIGRLLGGAGLATLGLGSGYIARTTSISDRQNALITYRVSQTMARMLGPFVGYFFLGLPEVTRSSSTGLQLFNFYTCPGWVAALVVLIVAVVFHFMFTDPSYENEHLIKHEEEDPNAPPPSRERFTFYSNIFGIFAGQYHAITSQSEIWKTFVGVGIGAAVGATIMKRGVSMFPALFSERFLSILSVWTMFTVMMLIIPWYGPEEIPSHATFYAATGIFGATVVWAGSAIETVFSKKVTQYVDVVGRENVAKRLGWYYMVTAAGRFAGPLVANAVTYIATPSGQSNYCPVPMIDGPNGPGSACPDTSTACMITADEYYVNGCVLYRAIPFYAAMAGLQFVVCLGCHFMLFTHWHYDNSK